MDDDAEPAGSTIKEEQVSPKNPMEMEESLAATPKQDIEAPAPTDETQVALSEKNILATAPEDDTQATPQKNDSQTTHQEDDTQMNSPLVLPSFTMGTPLVNDLEEMVGDDTLKQGFNKIASMQDGLQPTQSGNALCASHSKYFSPISDSHPNRRIDTVLSDCG